MELKEMGFTLIEVKSIFTFKRLGRLTSYQVNRVYQDIFKNRHNQLTIRLEELKYIETTDEAYLRNELHTCSLHHPDRNSNYIY